MVQNRAMYERLISDGNNSQADTSTTRIRSSSNTSTLDLDGLDGWEEELGSSDDESEEEDDDDEEEPEGTVVPLFEDDY